MVSLGTKTSIFNTLLSKVDELVLPSKSWAAHISDEKLALLSIKPTSYDGSVELFKSVVLFENEEQHLQVNTTIMQIPVTVPYLNYEIRDVAHLQVFLNEFEKVQFCKYFITDESKSCETVGLNFSDVCATCETANKLEINQQSNKENSISHTFECSTCPEIFSSLEAMKCHSYVFHDNQLIECTDYSRDAEKPESVEPTFICKICGNKSSSSQQLLQHELAHFNGSFVCIVCQTNFNCVQRLVTHTKKYHPDVAFISCHLCKKKFAAARYLRVHLRSHTNDHQYLSCSKCTLKFHSETQLKLHEKYHKTTNLNCRKCNKTFTENNQLFLHYLTQHPKRVFVCKICNSGFENKLLLIKHEETHGTQIFECKPCSKRFTNYNEYTEHNIAHRSGNRYICPNCRKSFPTLDTAEEHACALKSYKCDKCSKEFDKIQAYKMHCRRHGMQNTFECTVCKKSFSTRGNLAVHSQKHEREVSSDEEASTEVISATAMEIG